ncbi:hypothetical protein [Kistimonas asteriae]|uniref:hypothetical protein n=1 Tax=Kistimonas asteriae TaxID=517724 RepID=UPI001BABB270|nr:hypothetical protein [Kistimonas asteriae]
MRQGLKTLAVALALGAASSGAMAADDGDLGATSTGDFDIKLVHASGVRIWGLEDFFFDTDGATTQQQADINLCIFTNDATSSTDGQYDIIATGSDTQLTNGASDTLDYTVEFSDTKDNTGNDYQTLISGGSISALAGGLNAGTLVSQPDPSNTACIGENANIRVTIDPTGAPSGTYVANVNLLVSPN